MIKSNYEKKVTKKSKEIFSFYRALMVFQGLYDSVFSVTSVANQEITSG